MSDTPETIAAILAEMRAAGRSDEHADGPLIEDYADRIKAAADRERAITDIMLAVKDKPLPHPYPDDSPPLFFPMTKTQLQTLSDLVAIAHDEMDGLPYHEQELERFDSLLFDMKARYAFDKPYTAPPEQPSNAAKMREALEWVADFSSDDHIDDEYSTDGENLQRAAERARAALAAPPRNCDRFATYKEAVEAYRAWAERTTGDVSNVSGRGMLGWLFAPAEGGDHA